MHRPPDLDTEEYKTETRKALLNLLEGVSTQSRSDYNLSILTVGSQVRGKKNIVIEKPLAGPIGLLVKFSTLQDYGVDKVFLLENGNVDSSQRNVIFIARGEKLINIQAIAGRSFS